MTATNEGLPAADMSGASERTLGALRAVLAVAAGLSIGVLFWMALYRIPFPFELEWVEGSLLLQPWRILRGEPLYVAPSLGFVPVTYPPVYSLVSAAACAVAGVSYAPLRAVSFAATLGCLLVIGRWVSRESGSRFAGFAAAGLFAASFRLSGAWFDTAHVDSLHLLFQLLAIAGVRFARTRGALVLAGVWTALAFLTKQSGLSAGAALLAAAAVLHGRRALFAALPAVVLGGAVTLALDLSSDGWYGYYLFGQYATHGWVDRMWVAFWTEDLALHFGPAALLAAVALASLWRAGERRALLFHGLVGGGMIAMAYASRVHLGGFDNVLMPAHAWIAAMAGLTLAPDVARRGLPFARRWAPVATALAFGLQFALLRYDPREQIPTPEDLELGQRLLAELEHVQGEIFSPSRNWLPVAAGKSPSIHATAMFGILGDHRIPESAALAEELERALREQRWALVLSSGREPYQATLERYYRLRPSVFTAADRDAFWPLTGLQTRPQLFWVPRRDVPRG